MELIELNIIGRKTAKYSLLIGTSLLLAYTTFSIINWIEYWIGIDVFEYWTTEYNICCASLLFICLAFCVNLVILIPVLVHVIVTVESRKEYLKTALLMILNIPIVIVYFFVVSSIPTPPMYW